MPLIRHGGCAENVGTRGKKSRNRDHCWGDAVIQMRDNSGSDHGDCSRGGEKWSDSKWHFESRASNCKRIWRNPKYSVVMSISVIRV